VSYGFKEYVLLINSLTLIHQAIALTFVINNW